MLEGNAHGQFTVVQPTRLPLVLAPCESAPLQLGFNASRRGLQPVTLQVHSDDARQPQQAFRLVGTGVSAATWGWDYFGIELREPKRTTTKTFFTDKTGKYRRRLPADTPYHARIFDPISGLIANIHGTTAPAGQVTPLTSPRFVASTAPDSDGDFLPDDIEMAMDTDPHNPASNRRKPPDFEWLQRENRGRTH